MRDLNDIQIIESVKRGNQEDYSLLIDRYKDKAFSLLKRILKNDMDAEEALQDSFIKAFNSLNSFREESKFSTWFYRIVYNTALSALNSKRKKQETATFSLNEEIDLSRNEEKIYAETENSAEFVWGLVEDLPIRYAVLINLFYVDDLSYDEISKIMGISIVNVKVMLHRARNILRDLIVKRNYQEELI